MYQCIIIHNIHAESTKPELKDLCKYVTPRYASYWKEIGIFLDFKPEQLDIIKMDNPADAKRSCTDMFIKWLQIDPNASWEKFFTALDSAIGAPPANTSKILIIQCSVLLN